MPTEQVGDGAHVTRINIKRGAEELVRISYNETGYGVESNMTPELTLDVVALAMVRFAKNVGADAHEQAAREVAELRGRGSALEDYVHAIARMMSEMFANMPTLQDIDVHVAEWTGDTGRN